MISIPNYSIQEKIYEGSKDVIYRGKRESDNLPVILKFLKADYPLLMDVARLKYEYDICKKINNSGITTVYAMETFKNTPVLIMEDIGGEALRSIIDESGFNLKLFFNISVKLCEILDILHKRGIIHKDINPNNIIVNSKTGEMRIIDFGNSTLLSKENVHGISINKIEGTLPYISPEQTGRMNRTIDYRTDFYSLGVTFYEMLSKALPFDSRDELELIHCHIAMPPTPLSSLNGDIPKVVSDMVMKLMEKDADNRYQSAAGIRADLIKCLEQLEAIGSIDYFEIGKNDFCDTFRIPQKLYGREKEIRALMDAYKRICKGSSEIMLVTGFSGIGKTSTINEIYKPIIENHGHFIAGKFDQYNRNTPYSAIIQAFRGLIQQILCQSEDVISSWRTRLLRALGQNGQIIIDVIPEIELIAGKQPTVPELPAFESQNRFNLVFQEFLGTFYSVKHPLAIFLDDLQWADLSSLKLIETLLSDSSVKYLLLIGAYRDNEVDNSHPLMLTLKETQKSGSSITTLTLKPLTLKWVNLFVSEVLNCEPEAAFPLSELCLKKTGGNPFFLKQFISSLYKDNHIRFENAKWTWDMNDILKANVTDNIIDMLVERVQSLPQKTQNILKLAACIGNTFDLKTLSIISENTPHTFTADLWNALEKELILPLDITYKYADASSGIEVQYRFLHDRVQQAVYSMMEETSRNEIHLKIGQLMLKNIPECKMEDKLFDIANHFNFAIELISNEEERKTAAELNFAAGKRAKASAAYGSAHNYFIAGIKLLGNDGWQNHYDLMLKLYIEGTEAAYLSLNFDSMNELMEIVLEKATAVLDKVKVYEIKIQACMAQNNLIGAVETAHYALGLLGVKFPRKASTLDFVLEFLKTQFHLLGKSTEHLLNMPAMSEPYKLAVMRIIANIISSLHYTNSILAGVGAFRQINLSVRYGNAPATSYSYIIFGSVLAAFFNRFDSAYRYGQLALDLVEKFNSMEYKSKILCLDWYCLKIWKRKFSEAAEPLLEGYKCGLENGDLKLRHTVPGHIWIFCFTRVRI